MAERFERLCVIGLGYVGLPTAAVFATNRIEVVGVDVDPERVAAINSGAAPIVEPDLDDTVRRAVASGRLRAQGEPVPADAFIIFTPLHVPRYRLILFEGVYGASNVLVTKVAKSFLLTALVLTQPTQRVFYWPLTNTPENGRLYLTKIAVVSAPASS